MSREKQIEENGEEILYGGPREGGKRHAEKLREERRREMANDLAQHCPDLVANCCGASSCVSCLTRFLYEAGYRKQSEGEWIHSEFDDDAECSACGKAPYDFKFPLQNPDMARYCPYCGAKMRGVNYGNLLTWDEMKDGAE